MPDIHCLVKDTSISPTQGATLVSLYTVGSILFPLHRGPLCFPLHSGVNSISLIHRGPLSFPLQSGVNSISLTQGAT